MDYSIVIPVFNKAALTRHCLTTLRPTLEGAGEGEVIVIDNASSDETPQMLEAFPWVKVIRNERNLGFSGANNQGARIARGEFLVLLNNDTEPHPGWLHALLSRAREPGVGAVGARLLFPNGTLQHAGVIVSPHRMGRAAFVAWHDLYNGPGDMPFAQECRDMQVVTGACLVTPREVYLESGGLDEGFWNGYEDVDYCLRMGAQGLRVVYEGAAVVTHFESQSGSQRFRRAIPNIARLGDRWNGRVRSDHNLFFLQRGHLHRTARQRRSKTTVEAIPAPKTIVLCHGDLSGKERAEFNELVTANFAPVEKIVWATSDRAVEAARQCMELRGDRYFAVVDARTRLQRGWLDELVQELEWRTGVGAATYAPNHEAQADASLLSAGAGCTLIALRKFPQHHRLRDFPTLDGALADFLIRGVEFRAGVRGAVRALAAVPELSVDRAFEQTHGMNVSQAVTADPQALERLLAESPRRREGLVSIIMLSWNAVQFTKMAYESIRAHTRGEYELIIVDNGSNEETVQWLRDLEESTRQSEQRLNVIYNPENRGYAGGNNQAIVAASGEYVVLLNNDVIVTDGWLEGLLAAFDRIPGLGVSAPRSNKIAGEQLVSDAQYNSLEEMHRYAAERTRLYNARGYMTDRAIGLCLCIDRRVIDEVGGLDERYGAGNFEDDDFCLRVRAAGYKIHVCDDVFIHHFGSQTFAANKVDWTAKMRENWDKFAAKWNLPPKQVGGGYVPTAAIRAGFDRDRHHAALPPSASPAQPARGEYALVFAALARDEDDWKKIGAFARRYVRTFSAGQPVLLAIAATGELAAATLGGRLERLTLREGIALEAVADVEVSDEDSVSEWVRALGTARVKRVMDSGIGEFDAIEPLKEHSPSALRRAFSSEVLA